MSSSSASRLDAMVLGASAQSSGRRSRISSSLTPPTMAVLALLSSRLKPASSTEPQGPLVAQRNPQRDFGAALLEQAFARGIPQRQARARPQCDGLHVERPDLARGGLRPRDRANGRSPTKPMTWSPSSATCTSGSPNSMASRQKARRRSIGRLWDPAGASAFVGGMGGIGVDQGHLGGIGGHGGTDLVAGHRRSSNAGALIMMGHEPRRQRLVPGAPAPPRSLHGPVRGRRTPLCRPGRPAAAAGRGAGRRRRCPVPAATAVAAPACACC